MCAPPPRLSGVVVVCQCNGFTGDIEALLSSKVHAVLECSKHARCVMEPIQLFPHPGLDCGRFTHIMKDILLVQGVGSAFADTGGLAMVADRYGA